MTRVRAFGLVGAVAVILAGCGGGGDGRGDDGLKGTWSAAEVGSLVLDGEGGAEVRIGPDQPVAASYERVEGEEWDVIVTDEGTQAEAVLDGDTLTFFPGTWGQDDEFTLVRE